MFIRDDPTSIEGCHRDEETARSKDLERLNPKFLSYSCSIYNYIMALKLVPFPFADVCMVFAVVLNHEFTLSKSIKDFDQG